MSEDTIQKQPGKILYGSALVVTAALCAASLPAFVRVPSLLGCSALAMGLVQRGREQSLSLSDLGDGVRDVLSDFNAAWDLIPEGDRTQDRAIETTLIQRFPALQQFDTAEDVRWLTPEFILDASTLLVGPRGTCKTLTAKWMTRVAAQAGAIVRVIDYHHNPDHPQHLDWIPGIAHDDYVVSDNRGALLAIRDALETMNRRITGQDTNLTPYLLVWDEYQRVMSEIQMGGGDALTMSDRSFLTDAIKIIQDEGRKANVNVLLTMKSIKKNQSGLDSSTISQCNWLLLGKQPIQDVTAPYPVEISESRRALFQQQKAADKAGQVGAIAYIDGEAEVKSHPDKGALLEILNSYRFEVEEMDEVTAFFHPHLAQIKAWIQEGRSPSWIFDQLPGHGKRNDDNPKWGRLKQLVEETKNEAA